MAENDAFFSSEEVDKQLEQIKQAMAGDQLDAEAMAYLHHYYQMSAQQEQEALNRIWQRIAMTAHFEPDMSKKKKEQPMQQSPLSSSEAGVMRNPPRERPRQTRLMRQLSIVAAVALLTILLGSITLVFYAARQNTGSISSVPVSTGHAPFQVVAVTMSVTPDSLAHLSCGTNVTIMYTATFHVRSNSAGGTVQFSYTVNNGRSQSPASISFRPGETTQTYTFTWKGALPGDHTEPGPGGVQVTSPNHLTSSLVAPKGQCTSTPFQVTSVTMTVSPASIQGMPCGTSVVVTYRATLHATAGSTGGTVQFSYTVDNGRGQSPASVTFAPGQTTQSYTFTWRGSLPADHTYPGRGGIQVMSPNQLTSPLISPTGTCS